MKSWIVFGLVVVPSLVGPLAAKDRPKPQRTRAVVDVKDRPEAELTRADFAAGDASEAVSAIDAIRESIERLHPDEPLLPANTPGRQLPKRRSSEHPWVELTDLRYTKLPQGHREIELQCRVTEGFIREVVLVLKSEFGVKAHRIDIMPEQKSLIRIDDPWSKEPWKKESKGIEIWAEYQQGHLTPSYQAIPYGYKISQSVTIGTVNELTYPRHWLPHEEFQMAGFRTKFGPRLGPPVGYQLAEKIKLAPGTPVLYANRGSWSVGELVSADSDRGFTVRMLASEPLAQPNQPAAAPMLGHFPFFDVAVSTKTLEATKQADAKPVPSVRTLAGSLKPLPENLVPIPAGITLLPGTILFQEHSARWQPVFVVAVNKQGLIDTVTDSYWTSRSKREALAIDRTGLTELMKDDADAVLAKRWEEFEINWAIERRKKAHVRDYLATYPLPDGFLGLADKTSVKKGDTFKISYGNRWENVTAITDSSDGAVEVHWDRYGDDRTWDQFISRKSLFVIPPKSKATAPVTTEPAVSKLGKGTFSLILDDTGPRKIAVTKVVMKATGLDLRDARDAVNETPITLSQSLTQSAAEALVKEIEAAGGKARVEARE